jgi:hypothetical protein
MLLSTESLSMRVVWVVLTVTTIILGLKLVDVDSVTMYAMYSWLLLVTTMVFVMEPLRLGDVTSSSPKTPSLVLVSAVPLLALLRCCAVIIYVVERLFLFVEPLDLLSRIASSIAMLF